jgi:gamma-glutamylcyclotransferase (GGCT)/AIG2-like uncharacterized protein YtfP
MFVYGTLRDEGTQDWVFGRGAVIRNGPAAAKGLRAANIPKDSALKGYVFGDDGDPILGELLWFDPVRYEYAIFSCDGYESVSSGLYTRVEIDTFDVLGGKIRAWAYEWTWNGDY